MLTVAPKSRLTLKIALPHSVRSRLLIFGALVGVSLAACANALLALARVVRASSEYSHIALVLPVSVALLYSDRALAGVQYESNCRTFGARASLAVLISFGLRLVLIALPASTRLSASVFLLVTFWIAAFCACFGRNAARRGLFSLLFLYLLVPLPQSAMDGIVAGLQHASADVAALFFNATTVPVIRHEQVFILATQQIEVAPECSGIRSSMALLITGLVFGHLFLQTIWAKAFLAATILPLAIFKNGLRIFTLAVLGTYVDPSFLSGPLHHQGGVVFFTITLIVFVLLLLFLRKLERPRTRPQPRSIQPKFAKLSPP